MRYVAIVLSLFLAALVAAPAPARVARAVPHKFHVSFAEADYNAREQSLQVSLRTFPDDLENILGRRAGRAVSLDNRKDAGPLAFTYLQEVFKLRGAGGEPLKLSWVGMDASVDSVWLYFETKVPGGLKGVELSNQFMHDLFDDQQNKVSIWEGEFRHSMTFRRGDGFKPIETRRRLATEDVRPRSVVTP